MAGRRIKASERDSVIETVLRRLADGEVMSAICGGAGMPDRETLRRWCNADPALDERIRDAREIGYHERAERAVEAAKNATDAHLGRLALDAEKWLLSKLSKAFADRPPRIDNQTNVQVNVDAGNPFGQLAEFLDSAAAAVASGSRGTKLVVDNCPAGPGGATRGLDDVADLSRKRVWQDKDRS